LALGNVLSNYGGLCRNVAGVKEGTTTKFSIENCLYHPNVSQTEVYETTASGGTVFAGYDMVKNSRVKGYVQLIVNKSTVSSITKLPDVSYVGEAAALGAVEASLSNIVIVNNQDYLGAAADAALTANGIAGFQAVEEGYPLPTDLVAVFGTNVAGKSEITNPSEDVEEPTEPPTEEATEPEETVPPTAAPTVPNDKNDDNTAADNGNGMVIVIAIIAAVVVAGGAVAAVLIIRKKKATKANEE
jgi:hypothetical protein